MAGYPGTFNTGSTTGGAYLTTGASGVGGVSGVSGVSGTASWANYLTTTKFTSSIDVTGKLTANDVVIDGVSMKEMMKTIQDRLAILVPDPEKLEKYAALKSAYDHYKTLEALIGDGNNMNNSDSL